MESQQHSTQHRRPKKQRQKEKGVGLRVLFGIWLMVCLLAPSVWAASELELEFLDKNHHVTADRTLYHSNEKIYEAFGNVVISSRGQRLTADYAWIDTKAGDIKSRGNVILVTPTSVVNAAELHYSFVTQTGNIFYGQVTNEAYTLKGQLIRKVSQDRFLTTDGEYSTCRDCPESWKFSAKSIDMTIEGYAFMDSVYINIKDTPTLYIPYVVLPVKRQRQTGLLFPKLSTGGGNGFVYVQPLFVTLGEHQDLTLSYGTYSRRGRRAEFEHRYKSYDNVEGILNTYYLRDRTYQDVRLHRYAIKTEHNWPVWKPVHVKWRLLEVSDHEYPRIFPDVPGANEPGLESGVVTYSNFDKFFLDVEMKRYRNLIYDHPYNFDGGTVQAQPSVYLGVKQRALGPLLLSGYGRFDNYRRRNGGFQDTNANKVWEPNNAVATSSSEWLRETKRSIVTPSISAPFRIADRFVVAPSLEYNRMDYRFNVPNVSSRFSTTSRQYLVTTLETSTILEKVYDYDGETVSKFKHQMIPKLTYSTIPWKSADPNHPFTAQIASPGGAFDQFDIVPETNSTNFLRLPLGNSLAYGFNSRLIIKRRSEDTALRPFPYDFKRVDTKVYPKPINKMTELSGEQDRLWDKYGPKYGLYGTVWDFSMDQAYDFKEKASNPQDKKRAFSRLLTVSNVSLDNFSHAVEWKFFPRLVTSATTSKEVFNNVHEVSTSLSWTLKSIVNSRGTLFFRRAFSLGYSSVNRPTPSRNINGSVLWSLNDYWALEYGQTLDLAKKITVNNSSRILYNSVSECWQVGLRYNRSYNTPAEYGLELGVNLFGNGFTGVNQMSQSAGLGDIGLGTMGGSKP